MKKGILAAGSILWISSVFTKVVYAEEAALPQQQTVEQRLAILERKYENDLEAANNKAKDAAVITAGKDGFWIKSADNAFQLRVGGYIQADYRAYLNDVNHTGTDQFLVRRARIILEGSVNKFVDFRFAPDWGSGKVAIVDAYFDIKANSALKLRAGKYKTAVGLEVIQSDTNLFFVERSLVSGLLPNRDEGVQLFGDVANGAISYSASVENGTIDGGSVDGDTNDDKEYAGRIFLQPFKNTKVESLQEFGFGLAGTIGNQRGSTSAPLLSSYKTDGQEQFFTYSTTTFANGLHTRISPQLYWYTGPLGLLAEYAASAQDVNRSAPSSAARLINTAWQVSTSYVLTGEKASFKGVKPRHGLENKGLGAWEVAARFEEFRADPDSFSRYANPSTSAAKATSYTGGINWYLTSKLKWVGNYVNTRFEGGGTGNTDRPTEEAILTRLQVVF